MFVFSPDLQRTHVESGQLESTAAEQTAQYRYNALVGQFALMFICLNTILAHS